MIDSGRFWMEPFIFGSVLGGVIITMGIVAAVQSFSQKAKARMWLLVTQLVIACIALAVMVVGFILSIL